ncbi:2-methylcitrate dehydratase PrpD [Palleronia aestuarii]|uniref:2-methylcitrate dehydratase PrpD n=1 Tax=Palleronia aestuarii TaxID=568105 RepID=A0A2W7NAK1_9RHOB|nr:MmgE/PrpD family protein [Palleronia aestuarii]PZX15107.1 2-methylcitrate dehydratase PrpD [Palleronia aestuarii]
MNQQARIDAQTTPGATRALAKFVAEARTASFDDKTFHRARYHALDTIGALIAGAVQETTETTVKAVRATGAGGEVPVPGRGERFDMTTAALIAGTAGHGLEVDDGYRAGSVHPGTVIVPAALAAAWQTRCDGDTFLRSIIAGYEVMCRISAAIHPRARWRGFHNTPATGVFGATAVWCVMKGLDEDAVESAFGAACSTASGLFTFLHGGEVKRLHAGFGARSGLLSGVLAENGLQGPPGCLEVRDGFFHAYAGGDTGEFDYSTLDILSVGTGSPHAMTECYIKPYACCRHIHGPIDALTLLMREHDFTADKIEAMHVGTYRVAAAHDLRTWSSFTGSQMSIPFVLASAARFGRADIDVFDAAHRADPETAALAERVSVDVDPECEADYPRTRPARVTVTLKDGRRVDHRVDQPYGSPGNPLDEAALEAKFMTLATLVFDEAEARSIAASLWAVHDTADMRPLVESLARAS